MTTIHTLGLVGLGTMGANFARNLSDHGAKLVLLDTDHARATQLAQELGPSSRAVETHAALVRALPRPRNLFLLVPAGETVDQALASLIDLLEPGDAIIDGGNSFWRDTERRARKAAERSIAFLGFGVSGGADGARHGPAIMAGGDRAAVARVAPIFSAVAAKHDDQPCFVACGPGGAGHFVKMVHNGIEYAVMQLQAEIYALLRDHGLAAPQIADAFAHYNAGDLGSFLLECAIRALRAEENGGALVDMIMDTASQKGTGAWAAIAALELGIPTPSLAEAVFARCLSALRDERIAASQERQALGRTATPDLQRTLECCGAALGAANAAIHAQGFALMDAASREHGWSLDLGAVARAWRNGCIIRSRLMEMIADGLTGVPAPLNLLRLPSIRHAFDSREAGYRQLMREAGQQPLPVLSASLAYVDGYRQPRSGANLIAAQRDIFGRHGFARLDKPGKFNADWPSA